MARAVATPHRRTAAGRPDASELHGAEPTSRRDHIIELATRLFAEKGVAATTVRDIGEAAGILSGSLYYHFSSKEAIVEEIVRRYLTGLAESYRRVLEVHAEPRARLRGLIGASFQAIEQHRWACEIYQNDHKYLQTLRGLSDLEPLTTAVQSAWTDTIRQGVEVGAFRADIDAKVFYRFARDAIWCTVRWYAPGGGADIDELADVCTTILLDGFSQASA